MTYADWSYYVGAYFGNSISATDFPRLAQRASETIDDLTRNRAHAYYMNTDAAPIENAVCAVAEVIHRFERLRRAPGESDRGPVVSESNDGFSQSYAQPVNPDTEAGKKAYDAQVYEAAAQHLRWTGLLYVGVCAR